MDSATVVSATLFRPIGLAGASKENSTLIKFTFGFGGRKAYILVPDGQLESLQDSLYLTCRRSHIDQIYIEGFDVVTVTSKTQMNIVLAKLCMEFNSSTMDFMVD